MIAISSYKSLIKIINRTTSFIISIIIEIILVFIVFNNNFNINCFLSILIGILAYNIYSIFFKKEGLISAAAMLVIVYYLAGFAQLIFAALFAAKLLKDKRLKEFLVIPAIAFIIPIFG
ncbi:MAG: hypothetical protein II480_11095, partial [Bacteroidales bacterium]|nr:hypothetical protein [Bacteroidales bacterium]